MKVKMWVELAGNAQRWTEQIVEFEDDTTDQDIADAWEAMRTEVASGGWEIFGGDE